MIILRMAQMQVNLPDNVNKLLRRYVIEMDKNSREKATIYILENFLNQLYGVKK